MKRMKRQSLILLAHVGQLDVTGKTFIQLLLLLLTIPLDTGVGELLVERLTGELEALNIKNKEEAGDL